MSASPKAAAPETPASAPTSSGTSFDELNVSVLGLAPAIAMTELYVSAAQSNALLYANSVNQAKIANASADLAVLGGLMRMYDGAKPGQSAPIEQAKSDLSELVKLLNTLG